MAGASLGPEGIGRKENGKWEGEPRSRNRGTSLLERFPGSEVFERMGTRSFALRRFGTGPVAGSLPFKGG